VVGGPRGSEGAAIVLISVRVSPKGGRGSIPFLSDIPRAGGNGPPGARKSSDTLIDKGQPMAIGHRLMNSP